MIPPYDRDTAAGAAPQTPLSTALADRYRIERELGAGGMATVYLAEDLKHHRNVAIKVLHAELSAVLGPERFLKEIELTASLQHPHILPLFDSGSADGLLYYVMPFVEGETLRARLVREQQLPVADAVRIATEAADALQYAHERGVVHRDVKPENILLQNGHALVADFGIALAVQQAGGNRLTQTGLSLGTPSYMAPEQAMGERAVDARADIYALGAVTYEMLAGEPPFTGPNAQAILAQVLTANAPLPSTHRRNVPESIDAAVETALEKLPADRWSSAAEFAAALSDGMGTRTSAVSARRARGPATDARIRRSQRLAIAASAVAAAFAITAIAMGVAWRRAAAAHDGDATRFTIPVPPPDDGGAVMLAISADGRTIAYTDRSASNKAGIYVRRLDRGEPVLLAGTAGAEGVSFSPDGTSLAFTALDYDLRVVPVAGGAPVPIAHDVSWFDGIDWGSDGYIYFSSRSKNVLTRVRATGGAAESIARLEQSSLPLGYRTHSDPRLLPGGDAVAFSVYRGEGLESDIYVVDLRSRTQKLLLKGSHVVGVDHGKLLFVTYDGTLAAIPFDARSLAVRGAAEPLLTGVFMNQTLSQVALGGGTLIELPALPSSSQLVWVTRDGVDSPIGAPIDRTVDAVALSPHADRIALSETDAAGGVWFFDLGSQTLAPFVRDSNVNTRPLWTPDGSSVLFETNRGSSSGVKSLWVKPVDGHDTARVLIKSSRHAQEASWVAASPWVVFRDGYDDGRTYRDLRYVRPGSDSVHTFLASAADEFNPALSPDGHWLAYTSNQTGRDEVFVAAFPGPGTHIQVSGDGGTGPLWSHDGRALFYRALDGRFMAVDVRPGPQLAISNRRALFSTLAYTAGRMHAPYDIAPDDRRFLFVKKPATPELNVVLHFTDEVASRLKHDR
jgi:serine/threonine-protein kinase